MCGIASAVIILILVVFYHILRLVIRKNSFNKQLKAFEDSLALKKCFNLNTESSAYLKNLAVQCYKTGKKIDRHTDRDNNCESVSTIVYEMSRHLGFDETKTALYYCISMVYDAGVLEIPGYMFRAQLLNDDERKMVRTHVLRGLYFYDFVGEDYLHIFKAATVFHHENVNGSGYPEGLMNEEIPEIARIIHVVESYISLINRRAYHKKRTGSEAIDELRKHNGIYDQVFVDALEAVV